MKRRNDRDRPEPSALPRTVRVFHPGETGADSGAGAIAPVSKAEIRKLLQAVVDDHAVSPAPPPADGGRYAPGSEMARILGLDERDRKAAK